MKKYIYDLEVKRCSSCKQIKNFSEFYNCKTGTFGKHNYCKECNKIKDLELYRSIDGLMYTLYKSQKCSSKNRGHPLPDYTISEFKRWLIDNGINNLYDSWMVSDFNGNLKPSCDRLDDSKPYTFSNIRLVTWKENRVKSHVDMRSGKLTHGNNPQKSVTQYDGNMKIVAVYPSVSEAGRRTGVFQTNISKCCTGERKRAGGFIWHFTELND